MNKSIFLLNSIKQSNISHVLCVPCIYLKNFIEKIKNDNEIHYISLTREEEGVGISSGLWIGGKRSLLLIQNSGLGNSINAIVSLNKLYKIPLVMLISYRGIENERMVGQIPMGEVTIKILKTLDIDYYDISKVSNITNLINNTFIDRKIIAILIKPSYW